MRKSREENREGAERTNRGSEKGAGLDRDIGIRLVQVEEHGPGQREKTGDS